MDKDWESLPRVITTSPIDWYPATLDSDVPESWFDAQSTESDLIRHFILSEDGKLKEDPDGDNEEYFNAKQHNAVDRKSITAHLTSSIADDITQEYVICEYNWETVTVETYDDEPSRLCYPVQTCSQRRSMIPPVSSITNPSKDKETIMHIGNNKAHTIKQPKFLKPGKRDLSKYACFFPGANMDSIQRTFDATTQLGTRGAISGINHRNSLLSPNPILNVH